MQLTFPPLSVLSWGFLYLSIAFLGFPLLVLYVPLLSLRSLYFSLLFLTYFKVSLLVLHFSLLSFAAPLLSFTPRNVHQASMPEAWSWEFRSGFRKNILEGQRNANGYFGETTFRTFSRQSKRSKPIYQSNTEERGREALRE